MGRSESLRLGPFVGGINSASDASAIADSELIDAKNFELDLDGSLMCRPPIVETINNSAAWTERIVIIGRATLAGVNYIIGSNVDGTYAFNGTTWTLIRASLQSRVALQYQDFVFIPATPGSSVGGGYWNGTTWTADASMPRGESAIFHKARMFIVPGITATGPTAHQVRYTDPISISAPVPLVWPGLSSVSIGQGDGQLLVDIVVYNDNLMIFKQDSTYVYAYDTSPVDGVVRKINSNIGVTSRHCVIQYENSVFVFHEGSIFEIVNYDFERINIKTPFVMDGAAPSTRVEEAFMSLLGDRIVVRYFNRIYVYGLKTRTWTRWESQSGVLHNFGPLVEFPSNVLQQSNIKYYAGSSIGNVERVFYIPDGYDAVTTEHETGTEFDIECYVQTKNYDLADSHHYKRLFWWGADIVSVRDLVAVANPITMSQAISWDDISTVNWDFLSTKTWNQPITAVSYVETEVPDVSTLGRKFVKFLKSLRWRQINFEITLLCNGTTAQGPCRLFSFTIVVGSKQTVPQQVN